MMEKFEDCIWYYTASIKSTAGNKTRLFPSPFCISTSSRINLAGAFRSNHVAACITALRSAFEKIESVGHVTVPYLSKVAQHSSTADWLKC